MAKSKLSKKINKKSDLNFFESATDEESFFNKNKILILGAFCTLVIVLSLSLISYSNFVSNKNTTLEQLAEDDIFIKGPYSSNFFPTDEDYSKQAIEMENGSEVFAVIGSGYPLINKRLDSSLDTADGHRERSLQKIEEAWSKIAKSEQIILRMNEMNVPLEKK